MFNTSTEPIGLVLYAEIVDNEDAGHRRDRSAEDAQPCGTIKTDEPRTLDFSWVRGFLVTNVCIVQRSAA